MFLINPVGEKDLGVGHIYLDDFCRGLFQFPHRKEVKLLLKS